MGCGLANLTFGGGRWRGFRKYMGVFVALKLVAVLAIARAATFCERGTIADGVCCAKSACNGTCGDVHRCGESGGGDVRCCPEGIRAWRGPCQHARETACVLPTWLPNASSASAPSRAGLDAMAAAASDRLLPCTDRSAYVTLLVHHPPITENVNGQHITMRSTFLSQAAAKGAAAARSRMRRQMHLLLVLVRSLRRAERICRRDVRYTSSAMPHHPVHRPWCQRPCPPHRTSLGATWHALLILLPLVPWAVCPPHPTSLGATWHALLILLPLVPRACPPYRPWCHVAGT